MAFVVWKQEIARFTIKIETAEDVDEGTAFRNQLDEFLKRLHAEFQDDHREAALEFSHSGWDRVSFEISAKHADRVQKLIDAMEFPREKPWGAE
jgi:hypothetical protein